MSPFEEFSELLERVCFNSWRSALGKDDEALIEEVSSILFTKEETPQGWRFSFSLRRFGKWAQATRTVEPLEYDPYDPPPIDEYDPKRSMSSQNVASQTGTDMLVELAERMRG